jgi:putative nucleotidyltransferase with HDIG domain
MRREDLLLAAETAREQAELFERLGRNRDTLQALSLSHKLFTRLRAERNLADLARRVDRLESRFYDLVRRWAQTIESKDAYTLGHCERVADYACALARDVGFDEMTMFWFRIGAVLHDVGKVVVPSEILNKAGPLTLEERQIMERHAAAGSDLLRNIEFPWDILPMVRGHHERWDGTGYPDRLAGEAIALSARITCVADVFDALTTDRPYRAGFSREKALAMMAADSGRVFDPDLFARFERVIRTFQVPRRSPAVTQYARSA